MLAINNGVEWWVLTDSMQTQWHFDTLLLLCTKFLKNTQRNFRVRKNYALKSPPMTPSKGGLSAIIEQAKANKDIADFKKICG